MNWADVLRTLAVFGVAAVVLATGYAIADWFASRRAGR
jgi:hypothetical protein